MAKKVKPWYEDKAFLYTSITEWLPTHKESPSGNRGWRRKTYVVHARSEKVPWFFICRTLSLQEASDRVPKKKGGNYWYRIVEEWEHEGDTRVERKYVPFILFPEPPKPSPRPKPKAKRRLSGRIKSHKWDVLWKRSTDSEWSLYQRFSRKSSAASAKEALQKQWDGLPYEVMMEHVREVVSGK